MRRLFGSADRGRPDVIVDFVFEKGLFFIRVANIGDLPAYRVSVGFNHEITGTGGKSISAMPLFQRIEFMPPQKEISTFLDSSASYFKREQPVEIETRILFHDRRGKPYTNNIRHNLDIYRAIGYVHSPGASFMRDHDSGR